MSKDAQRALAVVILAAGKGTRMKSRRSKVLHEIAGRPMLDYALALAEALAAEHRVVVIGRDAEQLEETFGGRAQLVRQAVLRSRSPSIGFGTP